MYELTNHLGNVLATVSNKHIPVDNINDGHIDWYLPGISSENDYYPFGMLQPERKFNAGGYRFGFNGQEKVDEISGIGNHNTAVFWEYDARLARRCNLDPKPQINISDYATFANCPILLSDVLGDEVGYKTAKDQKFVESFTNKTELRKGLFGLGKLKERSNSNYNKEFSNIIADLDSREELYMIGENSSLTSDGSKIEGKFSFDGSNFNVEYSSPPPSFGGGKDAVLFEEIFHARQFTEGKFTFIKKKEGTWGALNADLIDEIEAKKFASTAKSYASKFNANGVYSPTQLGFIRGHTETESILFLKFGKTILTITGNNKSAEVTYDPIYPKLDSFKQDSKLLERTFDENVVGYPLKVK